MRREPKLEAAAAGAAATVMLPPALLLLLALNQSSSSCGGGRLIGRQAGRVLRERQERRFRRASEPAACEVRSAGLHKQAPSALPCPLAQKHSPAGPCCRPARPAAPRTASSWCAAPAEGRKEARAGGWAARRGGGDSRPAGRPQAAGGGRQQAPQAPQVAVAEAPQAAAAGSSHQLGSSHRLAQHQIGRLRGLQRQVQRRQRRGRDLHVHGGALQSVDLVRQLLLPGRQEVLRGRNGGDGGRGEGRRARAGT